VKILVLPGDGIGPEITDATLAVLDRANAKFRLGTRAFARHVAALIG
jgi:3-isopropylmalate dehydrogenase